MAWARLIPPLYLPALCSRSVPATLPARPEEPAATRVPGGVAAERAEPAEYGVPMAGGSS